MGRKGDPSQSDLLPWDQKNSDGKYLEHLVKNQSINPSYAPKEVWKAHPEFQKYKLDSFRSALNKLKKQYGTHIREKKSDDEVELKDGDNDGDDEHKGNSLFGVAEKNRSHVSVLFCLVIIGLFC